MSYPKPSLPRRGRRHVLLGDPEHVGAGPGNRRGLKRGFDAKLAVEQWQRLRDTLRDLDIEVVVVPPEPGLPGLVTPGNAGFLPGVDRPYAKPERAFLMANPPPQRALEKHHYRLALTRAGFRSERIDERYRFEGEADFFPAGDVHILTHGSARAKRRTSGFGIPSWKRVADSGTDIGIEDILIPIVAPRRIVKIELRLESHHHGDTALCAFGPKRQFLLASRAAIASAAWQPLQVRFKDELIELSEADTALYAANSFGYTHGSDSHLVLPEGVSEDLLDQIRDRGVRPRTVDVGEFIKTGLGGVKCLIGDLGIVTEG